MTRAVGIKAKLVEQTAPCLRWVPLIRRFSTVAEVKVLEIQIIKEALCCMLCGMVSEFRMDGILGILLPV